MFCFHRCLHDVVVKRFRLVLYDVGAAYALMGTRKGEAQEVLARLSSVLP